VYAARIDSIDYTFQASGSLWQDALVLQDLQTKSLWSQISGEAIMGPMIGQSLELVPMIHLTFDEFKQRYPNGKVLRKPERGNRASTYESYYASRDQLGIFGRADTFTKLDGKDFVYGLRLKDSAVAVAASYLEEHRFAVVGTDRPVIVALSDEGGVTAHELAMTPGTDVAYLVAENGLLVLRTKTGGSDDSRVVLDLRTGVPPGDSEMSLTLYPVVTAYWFAWVSFFGETELVK